MEMTIYQVHNVLRTYHTLLKSKSTDPPQETKDSPSRDRVTISKEALEKVDQEIYGEDIERREDIEGHS